MMPYLYLGDLIGFVNDRDGSSGIGLVVEITSEDDDGCVGSVFRTCTLLRVAAKPPLPACFISPGWSADYPGANLRILQQGPMR